MESILQINGAGLIAFIVFTLLSVLVESRRENKEETYIVVCISVLTYFSVAIMTNLFLSLVNTTWIGLIINPFYMLIMYLVINYGINRTEKEEKEVQIQKEKPQEK